MRILITSTPGSRNFAPVRTFAQAWQRLGHEVLVAIERTGSELASDAGLDCRPLERETRLDLRAAYTAVLAVAEHYKPHLIVHETAEFSAVLVGETLGVPVTRVAVVSGTQERAAAVVAAASLDSLRAELGLERDPTGARIFSGRGITLIPAVLEDPAARVALERYRAQKPWPRRLPDLWSGDDSPLVHLCLGKREPAVHRSAIEQLASLQMRVLVTLTPGVELGPVPAGVHVNPGLSVADVMPYTAVLVCDGASSTLTAALTAGVPMVAVPLSAGQALNAAGMADAGAGIALDGLNGVAGSVRAMLRSDDYSAAAERVAAEIAALPPVEDALSPALTSA